MKNKFEKSLKDVYDENWWIKGFVPFGYDEGGETFCFSTRACDYGCIYYFMSDCIDDENDVKMFTPNGVVERASWTHFYVIEDNKVIVGCGAIGSYWGKEDD